MQIDTYDYKASSHRVKSCYHATATLPFAKLYVSFKTFPQFSISVCIYCVVNAMCMMDRTYTSSGTGGALIVAVDLMNKPHDTLTTGNIGSRQQDD